MYQNFIPFYTKEFSWRFSLLLSSEGFIVLPLKFKNWINFKLIFVNQFSSRPFGTNNQKRCPFLYRGMECKCRQSRDTWSNRQIWPWVQNEAGQRLTEFCQENVLVIAKPSSSNTRDDSTCGHHQMGNTEIRLIIFFAAEDEEALYSQQKQDQ